MKKTLQAAWILAVLFIGTAGHTSAQQVTQMPDEPKETPFNTAMQTIGGKDYKLVLIGDCLPQLFIDGEKVGRSELAFYEGNIEVLSKVIAGRQKQEWERLGALREKLKEQIIADILSRKLMSVKGDVRSYYLTSQRFMVNGRLQDPDTFHFFRDRYIKSDDAVFYFER